MATGSATAVGLLLFAQAVPPLLAPFAGVIADRFQPRHLLSPGVLSGVVTLAHAEGAIWVAGHSRPGMSWMTWARLPSRR